MNIPKNAKLTPSGRERMVRAMVSGHTQEAASRDAGVCPRTAHKWFERFENEGPAGLADRSSRPHRLPCKTPADVIEHVPALLRQRLPIKEIALHADMSATTVSRILRAAKLSRATRF